MRHTILLAALAALTPAVASAACSDDVSALASKFGITASLPSATTASDSAKTEALAKSGGVIAPPPTGDMADVSPAVPNVDNMKTAPTISPQTADTGKTTKLETGAAADSQAASLLQAAREAGLKGDEASCRQRLADAKALLEKTPTQSQ